MTLAAPRLSSGTPTSARSSSIQMACFPSSTVVTHTKKKERERKFPKEESSQKKVHPQNTSQQKQVKSILTHTTFLQIHTHNLAFHKTLLSFRSAVLRYAQTIRILYLQRRYTSLRLKLPPKESRDRFKALVVIQETFYDFELTAAFKRAISDQEATITALYARPPTAANLGAAAGPS